MLEHCSKQAHLIRLLNSRSRQQQSMPRSSGDLNGLTVFTNILKVDDQTIRKSRRACCGWRTSRHLRAFSQLVQCSAENCQQRSCRRRNMSRQFTAQAIDGRIATQMNLRHRQRLIELLDHLLAKFPQHAQRNHRAADDFCVQRIQFVNCPTEPRKLFLQNFLRDRMSLSQLQSIF